MLSIGTIIFFFATFFCDVIHFLNINIYSNIEISGCEVIPVPLFQVLDGKNTNDYVARVEPSPSGGKMMAEYFLRIINDSFPTEDLYRYDPHPSPTNMILQR